MEKLLPCPFCGNKDPQTIKYPPEEPIMAGILCPECYAQTGVQMEETTEKSVEAAIAAWNRRASQS